jgi:hypothetical protein
VYIELSPQSVIAFCGAVSAVVGLVTGIVVWIVKGALWVKHQQEQDQEIQTIKDQHEADMNERLEESRLMIGGLLACLKAHQADGHNGPVTENIKSIETYLNNKAHARKE